MLQITPYLATIVTGAELAVDPNYDPNAGKSWWEIYFWSALLSAVQIAIGFAMCATGHFASGALMILSGSMGIIGTALSENIANAMGLTLTGAQAI